MGTADVVLTCDLSIFSLQRVGGISVVWGEYVSRLVAHAEAQGLRLKLWVPPNDNQVATTLLLPPPFVTPRPAVGKYGKFLPQGYRGGRSEILHMSYYHYYPLFMGKRVVTVHDFIHHFYGKGLQRDAHEALKLASLVSADVILCVSESAKQDMLTLHPRLARKDIRVTPNAVSDAFTYAPDGFASDAPPYLLWVGGRSGYKNFGAALPILAAWRRRVPGLQLRVVGPPLSDGEWAEARLGGVGEAIVVESQVSTERLRQLYSHARALVYTSLYEGFGLPILEAQRCHCPVICHPMAASREVGRDSVIYVDSTDGAETVDLLLDEAARAHWVALGLENARRYSWDQTFTQLRRVYQDLGWGEKRPNR